MVTMPRSTVLPHDDGVIPFAELSLNKNNQSQCWRANHVCQHFFRLKNLVDSGECIIFAAVFEALNGGAANERKTEKI